MGLFGEKNGIGGLLSWWSLGWYEGLKRGGRYAWKEAVPLSIHSLVSTGVPTTVNGVGDGGEDLVLCFKNLINLFIKCLLHPSCVSGFRMDTGHIVASKQNSLLVDFRD